MAYCLVCERDRENQGPRENRTYVDVPIQAQQIGFVGESLAEYQVREPNAVWFDPTYKEFLIEISKALHEDIVSGKKPLFHDGYKNLPHWQQQNTETGAELVIGSYVDPEDRDSGFRVDEALPDDRFILRVYDKDPVAEPSALNIGNEEFFEDEVNTTVERFFRLFDMNEQPINRNVANDRLLVSGYWLDLDWGASDGLSPGVARFFVNRKVTADTAFASDAGYRVLGPDGETSYSWIVYTKTLRAVQV